MNESWATLWESVASALPDHPALVQGERALRWSELDERASRLAAGLSALGTGRGSRVAVLLHNRPEYLETVFAAYKIRGAPVNLNVRYREAELAEVIDDSDAEVLVVEGGLAGLADTARARCPGLRAVLQVDDGSPRLDGALGYEEVIAGHPPMPRIERSGDDVFILYTGGTTGRPRGVLWRHRDIVETLCLVAYTQAGMPVPEDAAAVAARAVELRAAGAAPVFLAASPLMHGTAFYLAQVLWLVGGTVVLLEGHGFDAHEMWRAVERHRVTTTAIVGDVFARRMVAALDDAAAGGRGHDTSSLRRILSSGAAWTPAVKQALLDRTAAALVDQVGSTEGGPTMIHLMAPGARVEHCRWVLGSAARLLREDGSLIDPASGEVGLLGFSAPRPLGYHKDPERSASLFRVAADGVTYCVPGDHAYVDAAGDAVLLGRGSLCINTGGEKVYVEEVEGAILAHPEVLDANVVGLPDEEWGSAVVAVVALQPGAEVTEAEIQAAVRSRLAGYKVPRRVVVVDEVRRTPVGKAQYAWAREVAAAAVGG
ncbi:MAG TPA: AMP-binding protein [Candidatus Dormibacteraeota bacterium]